MSRKGIESEILPSFRRLERDSYARCDGARRSGYRAGPDSFGVHDTSTPVAISTRLVPGTRLCNNNARPPPMQQPLRRKIVSPCLTAKGFCGSSNFDALIVRPTLAD